MDCKCAEEYQREVATVIHLAPVNVLPVMCQHEQLEKLWPVKEMLQDADGSHVGNSALPVAAMYFPSHGRKMWKYQQFLLRNSGSITHHFMLLFKFYRKMKTATDEAVQYAFVVE